MISKKKNNSPFIEPWLNVPQVAMHLCVSKETVYRMLDRKTIPCHRIGKLWRFKASEVDKAVVSGRFE
jgi:excisionase family DNA binding protein